MSAGSGQPPPVVGITLNRAVGPAPADGSAECDFRFRAEEKPAVYLAAVARPSGRGSRLPALLSGRLVPRASVGCGVSVRW
jgi:hypothetical protein